jgi:hypothetical protein
MASVDALTFDKAAYAPGDTVTLTVSWSADTPGSASQTFNVTVNVNDASGNVIASSTSPLVVNTAQAGDTVSVSDDGGHAWNPPSSADVPAVFTTQV